MAGACPHSEIKCDAIFFIQLQQNQISKQKNSLLEWMTTTWLLSSNSCCCTWDMNHCLESLFRRGIRNFGRLKLNFLNWFILGFKLNWSKFDNLNTDINLQDQYSGRDQELIHRH
jgi:hypothetical protein